jgi:hypothetical protein
LTSDPSPEGTADLTSADLLALIQGEDARAAFTFLEESFGALPGVTLAVASHGYMTSLRVMRGDDWCYALVPGETWVLAHIRRPELRRGRITERAFCARFAEARVGTGGELKMRIHDLAEAGAFFDYVQTVG